MAQLSSGPRQRTRRHGPRAVVGLSAALLIALLPAVAQSAAPSSRAWAASTTYTNPVIAQTAPDPAVIKALDGYYYLIASSDYWQGGAFHILPIWRSTDLVSWTYVGDSFTARPDWVDPTAGLWAPDLQYYNHKYYMYYTASNTKALPRYGTSSGSAIGVATAASPAGPWTDMGDSAGGSYQHGPIVPPRSCAFNSDPNCYYWTFDPAEFTDQSGQKYLFYGSYFGGTLGQRLAADGLHTRGGATQIGHWDRYEGTYVVRHDLNGQPYYYNFSSSANCCQGPNTAYTVQVNRSTSITGTYTDQNGFPMLYPGSVPAPTTRPVDDPAGDNVGHQGGGYPTLKQNGNRWHGTGHNAVIADLSGQDWIVYHGVDKNNGWVNGAPPSAGQITYRQALIDRLDWGADGWPVVNSGTGPSDGAMPAPVTAPTFGDNFNPPAGCAAPGADPALEGWQVIAGQWSADPGTCTTGGFAEHTAAPGQALLVHQTAAQAGYRAECDLRLVSGGSGGRYGCVVSYQQGHAARGRARYLAVFLDPARNALVTVVYNNGHPIGGGQTSPLPVGFDHTDWHHLTIDEDAGAPGRPVFHITVSDRNRDPLAIQQRTLPADFGQYGGGVGFITQNAGADFDNVTIAPRSTTATPAQQTPPLGAALPTYSDEFNGSLGPQWSWIREDPSKHGFTTTALSITVNGDLYRDSNNATNLLVENPPQGNYVVETKITFDPNQNYQQAGLLVYSDDDHYIKVGPFHGDSLNKILSGHESLQPVPTSRTQCMSDQGTAPIQPSPTSNVAIHAYTPAQCPNEGEAWDYLSNPNPTLNGGTAYNPTVTDWLRIYHVGNVYTPYDSLDGVHWVKGASWNLPPAAPDYPVKIGLFAISGGSHNDVPALFDYVHVYSQP